MFQTFLGKIGEFEPQKPSFITRDERSQYKVFFIVTAMLIIILLSAFTLTYRGIQKRKTYLENPENTINCELSNRNEKDWCLLEKTQITNKNYCDGISDESLSLFCRAYLNNEERSCAKIPNTLFIDGCYTALAVKNNETSYCKKTTKIAFCEKEVMNANS